MIILEDILLPDPHDMGNAMCLSAYRVARRVALKALAGVSKQCDYIEKFCDTYEREHPHDTMSQKLSLEMHMRLQFVTCTASHYRLRLSILRVYMRYVRHVHGQAQQ